MSKKRIIVLTIWISFMSLAIGITHHMTITRLINERINPISSKPNFPSFSDAQTINIGDSKDEVSQILSSPDSKASTSNNIETWKYKDGDIFFKDGAVTGWDGPTDLLKVKINDNKKDYIKQTIAIGSSMEQVVKKCGTPNYINLNHSRHLMRLNYESTHLRFRKNKLSSYNNLDQFNFDFPYDESCQGEFKIDLGVTKEQVFACLGPPAELSMYSSSSRWIYPDYSIVIVDGKVTDYTKK